MGVPEFFRVAIVGLMLLVPVFFIYKRVGFNPAWALLVFVPGFGLLAIFLQLALMPWPNQKTIKEE
jgi:hypothetical protein